MKQEHSLQPYNPAIHTGVIYAAALEGVDVSTLPDADRLIGYGATKYGYGPACVMDLISTPYVAEPHITWFPWTSPADRIINFKWGMRHLAESRTVLLNVEKKHISFFEHFTKKGFLRKIGVIEDLPIVEEIHMYQFKRSVS